MKKLLLLFAVFAVCAAFADPPGKPGDEPGVALRARFRKMLREDRVRAIRFGLKHDDPVLRSRALLELFRDRREAALPELERAAADRDHRVRVTVLGCLRELPDTPARRKAAAILRKHAGDQTVAAAAGRIAAPFKFQRTKPRLCERDDWDYAITKVASVELPTRNWKFALDRKGDGHERNFYAPDFDDRSWSTVKVGNWEDQGFKNYDGFAWYRIVFDAPAKVDCNAVELNFGGVDEEAWVWLNGAYVGQHAVGASGWDKPFQLDVTDELRWGGRNVLVVRVYDARLAGGIWKPITLDILR